MGLQRSAARVLGTICDRQWKGENVRVRRNDEKGYVAYIQREEIRSKNYSLVSKRFRSLA